MPRKTPRQATRAAGTAGQTGEGGSARPALVANPGNPYRPAPVGNSMPPGGAQNPADVGLAPAPAKVTEIPVATVPTGDGTANQAIGGKAKPAAVQPNQSMYSNNPPGTSTKETETGDDVPPSSGGNY